MTQVRTIDYVNYPIGQMKLKANYMPGNDMIFQPYLNQNQENGEKKENSFFKKFIPSKKTMISIGLATATVVGLAVLGNKSAKFMAEKGLALDDVLKNSKVYNGIANVLKNAKDKTVTFLRKSKTIDNIFDTLQNRHAQPICSLAKSHGRGAIGVFAMTPPDVLKKGLKGKSEEEVVKILTGIMSEDKAKSFAKMLLAGDNGITDNFKFCDDVTQAIYEKFNCKNKTDLLNVFKRIEKGELGKEFTNVIMVDDFPNKLNPLAWPQHIFGDWAHVRAIDKLGQAITGKEINFCRGNLGDALLKYNVMNNKMADTRLASWFQKSILLPTESISNHVNDKSFFGFLICSGFLTGGYVTLFNNAQEVHEKRKAGKTDASVAGTIADDFVGGVANWCLVAPTAAAITYGAASMANLKDTTFLSKVLKFFGKIPNLGLGEKFEAANKSFGRKSVGFAAGLARLIFILFILTPILNKPVRKAIQKIFGKPPYEAGADQSQQVAAAQQSQQEAITAQLLMSNPELLQAVQNNKSVNKAELQKLLMNAQLSQQQTQPQMYSNNPFAYANAA